MSNIKMSKKNFNTYLNIVFPTLTKKEQYKLMIDPKFIKNLINTDANNLYSFAKKYFTDSKMLDLFFSSSNKKIFLSNRDNFFMSLHSIPEPTFKLLIPYLLKEENHDLFEIKSSYSKYNLILKFINLCYEESISTTNEYLKKHLSLINGTLTNGEHLLRHIEIDNPLNSSDLDFLLSLKASMSSEDQEQFFSLLKPSVVNTLLEAGLYNLLSEKDKSIIASKMHWEYNDTPDDLDYYRYSPALLTNKDFFKYILLDCKQNSFYTLKTLKYIGTYYPLVKETYSILLTKAIKNKKVKTVDDLAFIFFGDYLHNLRLNLKVIKDYASSNPQYKEKLDASTLDFLTNLDFWSLKNQEEIDACYQKLTDTKIDFKSVIYDYISLARDTFAKEVNVSLTNIEDCDECYETEGVKVHYYNGKDFAFIVHCSSGKGIDLDTSIKVKLEQLSIKNPKHYLSTSYINPDNINVYYKDNYIFGFSNVENMDLITASYKDAFTENSGDDPVNQVPSYLPLSDFAASPFYSELLYKKKALEPEFIVCFDTPDEYDLMLAKSLKIDVVCINSKKYKYNSNASKNVKSSLNEEYRK